MAKDKLLIYCDGGARGNPGPAASAFVAYHDDKKVGEGAKFLGVSTNNVAEYTSLLLAMQWLKQNFTSYKDYNILVVMDSQLVVKQLTGEYKIKNENLRQKANEIKDIMKSFSKGVKFSHVFRTNNKEADKLVNQKLNEHLV